MTITLATERNDTIEATLEWEPNVYYAKVYENWCGDWHETHTSRCYKLKEDAMRSYKRFVRRYVK